MTMAYATAQMRFEEYLRGQIKGGQRRGEFSGKPEETGDNYSQPSFRN